MHWIILETTALLTEILGYSVTLDY